MDFTRKFNFPFSFLYVGDGVDVQIIKLSTSRHSFIRFFFHEDWLLEQKKITITRIDSETFLFNNDISSNILYLIRFTCQYQTIHYLYKMIRNVKSIKN